MTTGSSLATAASSRTVIVRVRDLTKDFPPRRGPVGGRHPVRAVDSVNLEIVRGETLAVVGESGCGKSTLARALVRLVPISGGSVEVEGDDISHRSVRSLRPARAQMQLIFQDSFAALNPRHTVGTSIGEALRVHRLVSRSERRQHVERLLELVGLGPEQYGRYPRELSGGQRQRICIARALAVRPKLLVCDEPVSALDVSIQAQIINLLLDLREELGLTYVFISHDLGVVRQLADRVAVMYLGRIVELASAAQLFAAPRHPYTAALLAATPIADPAQRRRRTTLQGDPPNYSEPTTGCPFQPRCPRARDRCTTEQPILAGNGRGGSVECHYPLVPGEGPEPSGPSTPERPPASAQDRARPPGPGAGPTNSQESSL